MRWHALIKVSRGCSLLEVDDTSTKPTSSIQTDIDRFYSSLPSCPPPSSLPPVLSRRGAACRVVLPRVCASWRASCVSWQPAARRRRSAGFPAPSCRAAASSRRAFASSGPTRLWDDAPLQVRTHAPGINSNGIKLVYWRVDHLEPCC